MGQRNPINQLIGGFQPSFWWCRISSIHSMYRIIRHIILKSIQRHWEQWLRRPWPLCSQWLPGATQSPQLGTMLHNYIYSVLYGWYMMKICMKFIWLIKVYVYIYIYNHPEIEYGYGMFKDIMIISYHLVGIELKCPYSILGYIYSSIHLFSYQPINLSTYQPINL